MSLLDMFNEIGDLNEPACMDKILVYLDEIKQEDESFMEVLVKKVEHEIITWEQPWYQQSNSYTRPLKETNIQYDGSHKTDTISKSESDQILHNWQDFVQTYSVPDKLICLVRWKNKDKSRLPHIPEERARRFVISYLARGLERTLFQVFRHILTYCGGSVKGSYSREEEKIMQVCFTHHPNHAVTLLSTVLGREPRGIYKRLHEMFNGKPQKKRIKWSLELATKLVTSLMEYTGLPLHQLKYKRFDKQVWLKLGQDFDHHYIYLQQFWYSSLHPQLFVKKNVKINKLRKKVYKIIKLSPYQIWSDIRWKDIALQFPDGFTHHFLYQACSRLVRKKINYQKEPLDSVIDYALSRLKHCRKRRLRTLRLNENRQLEIVMYSESDNKHNTT